MHIDRESTDGSVDNADTLSYIDEDQPHDISENNSELNSEFNSNDQDTPGTSPADSKTMEVIEREVQYWKNKFKEAQQPNQHQLTEETAQKLLQAIGAGPKTGILHH